MTSFRINKLNIAQIFSLLFLVSLFFPIRYVFPTQSAFKTGAYSDFTSISLYLSDIFLFTTWFFCFLPRGGSEFKLSIKSIGLRIFIFWLILELFLHFRSFSSLNWWFLAKYLELIVAYGTICHLFKKTPIKRPFIKLFVFLGSLESLLAVWQFVYQKSFGLGLNKLGEQILSPNIHGVAKIVSGGTTFIRGYGTFPHPNLLSAFLVTSIFLSLYLLLNAQSFKSKILYSLAIFINCIGLTITFSRAGFLALGVGLAIFFGFLFWAADKGIKKRILSALGIIIFSLVVCFGVYRPYLAARATVADGAALERIFYARIGLKIIKQYPAFGVGIGESVLHMQQYAPFKLWPWQIQPIHNYFLLAAAELGIPGALILLWIFLQHLWLIIKKIKSQNGFELTTYYLLLTTILASFLLLMQFDHYFYTLQQTQMLLWMILGIIAAETRPSATEAESFSGQTKNPQTGD